MNTLYGASKDGRGGGDRSGWQHKCHRGDHRPVRILAAGHRAVHHPAHIVAIMAAVCSRCGTGGSLLVMMLWNIAKAVGAASHGATRPGGSCERHIKKDDGQQAHERGKNSAAIWGTAVHRLCSGDLPIISPIDWTGACKLSPNCNFTPDCRANHIVSLGSEQGMHQLLLVRKSCSGRFPKRAPLHLAV
jgi:hypothetical protein